MFRNALTAPSTKTYDLSTMSNARRNALAKMLIPLFLRDANLIANPPANFEILQNSGKYSFFDDSTDAFTQGYFSNEGLSVDSCSVLTVDLTKLSDYTANVLQALIPYYQQPVATAQSAVASTEAAFGKNLAANPLASLGTSMKLRSKL